MDGIKRYNTDLAEVNLLRILDALLHKLWIILLASAGGALTVFAVTYFFVSPKYASSVLFYVNNNSLSAGSTMRSIDSGDIAASKSLVNTYIVILNTEQTLNDVIDYAKVDRSVSELDSMIRAEAVKDTQMFRVVVTSVDPEEANGIADAISYILPKRISNIVEGSSAKIVSQARNPAKPSSPSYGRNALMGFLLGFVLSAGWIVTREMMDVTVRKEEDIAQICQYPILAMVPDMNAAGKGQSCYAYPVNGKRKKKGGTFSGKKQQNHPVLLGSRIGFAASEAYKLLRTKLQFSFADDNDCRVIGVSSAVSGEGKSVTAVNLAYSLAQLDKKVLLVDCDMRRPTLAEKLQLLKQPGLSSYLTRQCQLVELIQKCALDENGKVFHVIPAGQNPPNPVELLSSERMQKALAAMGKVYDYVILDLPPVGEVSDALAVAGETDGILLVVRQDLCDRFALADTIRQFEFVQARILGVVFNGTGDHGGYYGNSEKR